VINAKISLKVLFTKPPKNMSQKIQLHNYLIANLQADDSLW